MQLDQKNQEILRLKAQGKANKEVAPLVNLGENGVKYRLKKMFRQFNVSSSAALVAYAIRNNLM